MNVVYGSTSIDDLGSFLDRVAAIREETGTILQAFDPDYVVGERHLRRAAELAVRSFDRGENVAEDPAVELLLYAAGRRQIDRALEMGVSAGDVAVVFVVLDDEAIGSDRGWAVSTAAEAAAIEMLETAIEPREEAWRFDPDRVRAFFDIDDRELSATEGDVEAIVLERVALLDVEK